MRRRIMASANVNSAKSRFVTALTSEGGTKTEIGFGSDFYGYDIRFNCRDYNGWGSVIYNNSSNDFIIGHHGNNGEGSLYSRIRGNLYCATRGTPRQGIVRAVAYDGIASMYAEDGLFDYYKDSTYDKSRTLSSNSTEVYIARAKGDYFGFKMYGKNMQVNLDLRPFVSVEDGVEVACFCDTITGKLFYGEGSGQYGWIE